MTNGLEVYDEVKEEIIMEFRSMFKEVKVDLPEEVIEFAIEDVYETSALADEGYFTIGDIKLACQRTLLHFMQVEGY